VSISTRHHVSVTHVGVGVQALARVDKEMNR
jgi:hypothetical protein